MMMRSNITCLLFSLSKTILALFVIAVPLFLSSADILIRLGTTTSILGIFVLLWHRRSIELSPLGRSVLVTGCDTGFGHSLVKQLDQKGVRVFAGCLNVNSPGARLLRSSCSKNVHVIGLDISNEDNVRQAYDTISQQCKDTGLWAVVNNAAIESIGDIEFLTMDIYKKTYEVNLFGTILVTKTMLPLIRQAKGRVINVTSVKGRLPQPGSASYTTAKFAMEAFSVTLRLEMRKWRVGVIIIEPGNFGYSTGMSKYSNLTRLENDFEEMWREASSETRDDYGETYHRYCINCLNHPPTQSSQASIAPVTDAMTEAILKRHPKMRYMVPGNRLTIDMAGILTPIVRFLPEKWLDSLLVLSCQYGFPVPRALH